MTNLTKEDKDLLLKALEKGLTKAKDKYNMFLCHKVTADEQFEEEKTQTRWREQLAYILMPYVIDCLEHQTSMESNILVVNKE